MTDMMKLKRYDNKAAERKTGLLLMADDVIKALEYLYNYDTIGSPMLGELLNNLKKSGCRD